MRGEPADLDPSVTCWGALFDPSPDLGRLTLHISLSAGVHRVPTPLAARIPVRDTPAAPWD